MKIVSQQILDAVQSFNETEIRFHIIDPILRRLGYPGDESVYVKLEEKLEYPFHHIGHRSKKDVPLGYPDYRAGLKGRRGSFIVEAKAGNIEISKIDLEQAHSYAAHAQVGANFFALSNGNRFVVFETLSGPDCPPIIDLPIADLDSNFHQLENILSPASLAKHCQVNYDLALRLCDGLGSTAKIKAGEYGMDQWEYRILVNGTDQTAAIKTNVPQLAEYDRQLEMMAKDFVLQVDEGIAGRDENGQIFAELKFSGATKNNHEGMKILGLDKIKFASSEKFLSTDENNPSVFESTAEFSVAQGTMMGPMFGATIPIETDVDGDFFISARIHKSGEYLLGDYVAMANYRFGENLMSMELDFLGHFSLRLLV